MNSLFVYGTLMFPEIAKRVARIEEIPVDAVLSDFQRFTIEDREIAKVPAIVAKAGAKVHGKFFAKISDESLILLDKFEGIDEGDYSRIKVLVKTIDGENPCYTYVLSGNRKLGGAWNPDEFAAKELRYYLDNIVPKFEVD